MRTFSGRWEVAPFAQSTLDRVYGGSGSPPPGARRGALGGALGALGSAAGWLAGGGGGGGSGAASLVTLEQAIAPRVTPPGPLMRMVRGMCARTVANMMADLQAEIARRRAREEEGEGRGGGRQRRRGDGGGGDGGSMGGGGSKGGGRGGGDSRAVAAAAAAAPAACVTASALPAWRSGGLFALATPLEITIEL